MAEFYSYLWLRPDDSPYYVGKGYGDRAFVLGSHNVYPPKDRSCIVIFPQDSEADALESEKALIWLFGRKDLGTGCLRNLTDGGEGVSGLRHSEETKLRMSQKASLRKRSSEHKRKIGLASLGNKYRLGKPQSAATRQRISESLIGNHRSPGWPKGKPRGKREVMCPIL